MPSINTVKKRISEKSDEAIEHDVTKILLSPQDYASSGAWLYALREAGEKLLKEIGEGMKDDGGDLSHETVRHWEMNVTLPTDSAIEKLIQANRYHFPADEQGIPTDEAASIFRQLAAVDKKSWHARLKAAQCNYISEEKTLCALSHGDEKIAEHLRQEITQELAGIESGEGLRFSIILQNQPVRVMRMGDAVGFSSEDIEKLVKKPLFTQRLQQRAASQLSL